MPRHPARIAEDLRRESRLGGTADGLDNLCALLQEAADALDDQALPDLLPAATRVTLDVTITDLPADERDRPAFVTGWLRGALRASGLDAKVRRVTT